MKTDIIKKFAKEHDSFYLYDEAVIAENIEKLQTCYPHATFLYSVKCNPNKEVLHAIFSRGFGADAASAGEVKLAVEAGLSKDRIYYSAPGKTLKDIKNTMDEAVLIADSLREVARIQKAAEEKGVTLDIGLRVNPLFSYPDGEALPAKFGIDEEDAAELIKDNPYPNVRINGLHIHLRSQSLDGEGLASYYQNIFAAAERLQAVSPVELEYLNMGSGMGITYGPEDEPLDIPKLAAVVCEVAEAFGVRHPGCKIFMETGRYVTGHAGLYVTKVIDKKTSRGKTYVLLKNTLNGFIRPSMARMAEFFAGEEEPKSNEPFFTSSDAFQFIPVSDSQEIEWVTLVGNLCTAADVIAEDVWMPVLEEGDLVVITNAGAYAASISPMQFSSQEGPAEIFLPIF